MSLNTLTHNIIAMNKYPFLNHFYLFKENKHKWKKTIICNNNEVFSSIDLMIGLRTVTLKGYFSFLAFVKFNYLFFNYYLKD